MMDEKQSRHDERVELIATLLDECFEECERQKRTRQIFFLSLAIVLILNLKTGSAIEKFWHKSYSPTYEFYVKTLKRVAAFARSAAERDALLAEWLLALLGRALSPIFEKLVSEENEKRAA
ncbi:MAG: hypothetical protein MUC28_03765 [Planctomycetes bacterium]|jgi:hypothetical protein|nr:hypothetical protein [Planctomycetota bacterium]